MYDEYENEEISPATVIKDSKRVNKLDTTKLLMISKKNYLKIAKEQDLLDGLSIAKL